MLLSNQEVPCNADSCGGKLFDLQSADTQYAVSKLRETPYQLLYSLLSNVVLICILLGFDFPSNSPVRKLLWCFVFDIQTKPASVSSEVILESRVQKSVKAIHFVGCWMTNYWAGVLNGWCSFRCFVVNVALIWQSNMNMYYNEYVLERALLSKLLL